MTPFSWSPDYAINNELVDSQHKGLFDMLEALSKLVDARTSDGTSLSDLVDRLMRYCRDHFADEEQLMEEFGIDERHLKLQRMEHRSFTYDMARVQNFGPDETEHERLRQLVRIAGAWLVYHTLRTDQQLGFQLRAIANGASPAAAYSQSLQVDFGARLHRRVTDALVCLWTEAAHRAVGAERALAAAESMADLSMMREEPGRRARAWTGSEDRPPV